jgi:hypothetical protein
MKKLLFLILLLPSLCWGQELARLTAPMMGAGVAAAASAYTEEFFWNGDHPDGADHAYIANRTATMEPADPAGLHFHGTSQPAGATDPGTSSADGGKVLKIDSWSARLNAPITTKDIFDSAQGLVSLEYYNAASTGSNELFRVFVDASNKLLINVTSANTLHIRHDSPGGGGVIAEKTSTATFSDGEWVTLQARWDAATDTVSVKVGTNAWEDSTGNTNMSAFSSEPGLISIGTDDNGFTDVPGYIDSIKIWTTYDGS